jgi:broad specificity phosphatase PhoE
VTRLVLIRHGETDWNVEGRYQGQADPPLNARGRDQAQRLARELERISKVRFQGMDPDIVRTLKLPNEYWEEVVVGESDP